MARIAIRKNQPTSRMVRRRFILRFIISTACPYCTGSVLNDPTKSGGEMKRIVSILLSVMFVLALGITVSAQQTPGVDGREHRQRRIHQGVRSGALTRREAARLERQQ